MVPLECFENKNKDSFFLKSFQLAAFIVWNALLRMLLYLTLCIDF